MGGKILITKFSFANLLPKFDLLLDLVRGQLSNYRYMENITGFMGIKKPVIPEITTIIIATLSGTDTPFLTKMQKWDKTC